MDDALAVLRWIFVLPSRALGWNAQNACFHSSRQRRSTSLDRAAATVPDTQTCCRLAAGHTVFAGRACSAGRRRCWQ
ncbi:hypothetical protein BD311DRAFT_748828 [Dichomitus squalens]|uniref:Secreted protein n=1 Tax=Dichomitus squalens TaxID=114155 RepID=A0A4Q9MZI3_9APHY|nr:hypothetical protein BD311DRAFT_748828 [Dichomitus squalens]